MKKILLLFLVFFLVACGVQESRLEEINYKDFKKAVDNKESFILEIVQEGCVHCNNVRPTLIAALEEANLKAKVLDVGRLNQDERLKFADFFELSGFSTPTVFFIRDGTEFSSLKRIVGGGHDKEFILEKFESTGFTEGEDHEEIIEE